MNFTFRTLVGIALFQQSVVRAQEWTIHAATASPSGRYRLASQAEDRGEAGNPGTNVALVNPDRARTASCFAPFEAYQEIDIPGREGWRTRGFWNKAETLVAVRSGGNTWSRLDFYFVQEGRISLAPQPDWESVLLKHLHGYSGETTRQFGNFLRWADEETCVVSLSGTARISGDAGRESDDYVQFDFEISLRLKPSGIEILQVKDKETDK